MIPVIIANQPATKKIVIHTDILCLKQGSEILKRDFTLLLELLGKLQHHTTTSGPIPTLNRGIESLSRLLSLNTWLPTACSAHKVHFIDNFNIFWNCNSCFKSEGLPAAWCKHKIWAPESRYPQAKVRRQNKGKRNGQQLRLQAGVIHFL